MTTNELKTLINNATAWDGVTALLLEQREAIQANHAAVSAELGELLASERAAHAAAIAEQQTQSTNTLTALTTHRDKLASVITAAGEFIAKGDIQSVVAMWQNGQKSAAQLELEALERTQAELDAKRAELEKVLE